MLVDVPHVVLVAAIVAEVRTIACVDERKDAAAHRHTRLTFVAWPPPGYVPYQVTWARWSFGYPDADFTSATVTMTSNGVPISVALEVFEEGYGENTLIWVPANLSTLNLNSFPPPATDTASRSSAASS